MMALPSSGKFNAYECTKCTFILTKRVITQLYHVWVSKHAIGTVYELPTYNIALNEIENYITNNKQIN